MSAMAPAKPASTSDNQRPFLRPVPRRRSEMLLLKPVDVVWLVALAVLSCALVLLAAFTGSANTVTVPFLPHALVLPVGGAALATTAVGAYLTGLRLKDRATAIMTGLLVATSLALAAGAAAQPFALVLAAFAVFSLFSYTMGWTVASLCLAGVAMFVGADMATLGVALILVAFCQRRRLAWAGAMAFLLFAAGALWLWLVPWRAGDSLWMPLGHRSAQALDLPLLEAAIVPTLWFLFAYLTEWSQRTDRAKWWAPALWVGLALLVAAGLGRISQPALALPMLPVIYLMAAAGIARLLPAFAGEFARPLSRYTVAVAAFGVILAARAGLEWTALRGHPLF